MEVRGKIENHLSLNPSQKSTFLRLGTFSHEFCENAPGWKIATKRNSRNLVKNSAFNLKISLRVFRWQLFWRVHLGCETDLRISKCPPNSNNFCEPGLKIWSQNLRKRTSSKKKLETFHASGFCSRVEIPNSFRGRVFCLAKCAFRERLRTLCVKMKVFGLVLKGFLCFFSYLSALFFNLVFESSHALLKTKNKGSRFNKNEREV